MAGVVPCWGKWLAIVVLLVLVGPFIEECVTVSGASINVTLTCTSCTTYTMTGPDNNVTVLNCPGGTVCSDSSAHICALSNPCDGEVCDRYKIFPSSSSCQSYHICRYLRGLAAYQVVNLRCPGAAMFDAVTRQCTMRSNAVCYNSVLRRDSSTQTI